MEITGSKEERFENDFFREGQKFLDAPTPFAPLPFWISLAGQVTVDDAVTRWEHAHHNFPGDKIVVTDELRTLWDELTKMITEIHASAFFCWMRFRLTQAIRKGALEAECGEDWETECINVYFSRLENCYREPAILDLATSGCLGVYFKTNAECYDMFKSQNVTYDP